MEVKGQGEHQGLLEEDQSDSRTQKTPTQQDLEQVSGPGLHFLSYLPGLLLFHFQIFL